MSWRRGPGTEPLGDLVEVAEKLLGAPEKWAVYRVPGEPDLPDPTASPGRRERWWRRRIATVAEALLLTDPDADRGALLAARDLLSESAFARERGLIAAGGVDAGPATALGTVLAVVAMLGEEGVTTVGRG